MAYLAPAIERNRFLQAPGSPPLEVSVRGVRWPQVLDRSRQICKHHRRWSNKFEVHAWLLLQPSLNARADTASFETETLAPVFFSRYRHRFQSATLHFSFRTIF